MLFTGFSNGKSSFLRAKGDRGLRLRFHHAAGFLLDQDLLMLHGDNLVAIAREYSCDLTVLAKANRLKGPRYRISPGQKLILTGCEG